MAENCHIPAAPERCSFRTEAWLWSFGEVIQHILWPTEEADHPCYHWTVSFGSESSRNQKGCTRQSQNAGLVY